MERGLRIAAVFALVGSFVWLFSLAEAGDHDRAWMPAALLIVGLLTNRQFRIRRERRLIERATTSYQEAATLELEPPGAKAGSGFHVVTLSMFTAAFGWLFWLALDESAWQAALATHNPSAKRLFQQRRSGAP